MTTQHSRNPSEEFARDSNLELFTSEEKFELLSAYLDDEVTGEERRLVDRWLVSDLELQAHHQKQVRLRKALRKWL